MRSLCACCAVELSGRIAYGCCVLCVYQFLLVLVFRAQVDITHLPGVASFLDNVDLAKRKAEEEKRRQEQVRARVCLCVFPSSCFSAAHDSSPVRAVFLLHANRALASVCMCAYVCPFRFGGRSPRVPVTYSQFPSPLALKSVRDRGNWKMRNWYMGHRQPHP